MSPARVRSLAGLLLLVLPLSAGAVDMRFEQGSLIIPMQRAYQSNCGVVSAYGLVYRYLQKGVKIYWAVNPTKASHHRCKNTTDPNPKYYDGCDMEVAKDTGRPVSLLDNASGGFSDDFPTLSTTGSPNNTGEPSITVNASRTLVRYMGGPFIITATDASRAMDLLRSDPDFALFRTNPNGTCSLGSTATSYTPVHYVRIHRANNAFVAPIARVMNEVPPPIALIDGHDHDTSFSSLDILKQYLKNAGLDFPGAGGSFASHGQIFDVISIPELKTTPSYPHGVLNHAPDPTQPNKTFYKVAWIPHWEGGGDPNTPDHASIFQNIARFADLGNGIFNECASIELFEDSYIASSSADTSRLAFADNEPTHFMSESTPLNGGLRTLKWDDTRFFWGSPLANHFVTNGQDCTDPGVSPTDECYQYRELGNLFIQKGDYLLDLPHGTVGAFKPRLGRSYEPGTVRLVSTRSTNAEKDSWDIYAMRQKDNNRNKGNIFYLGGHNLSKSAAGTRIVLNTLLNLAYKPESTELSRSEPVADVARRTDGTWEMKVLSGTFLDMPPSALHPERLTFQPERAADWVFPYIEGRFRSIPAEQIGTSLQTFSQGAEWEASTRVPAPGSRTLFTVLGSNQQGLVRIPFTLTQLTSSCQDEAATGRISSVCDLQDALELDVAGGVSSLDADGDGAIDAAVPLADVQALNHTAQHFIQRVRGFCVAHDPADGTPVDTMTPTIADCDNRQFGEVRSTLGGLDHASAAVVGPSQYIPAQRPVVAYIGGYDGQLHAIYLRGTQTGFAPPPPGTELWAFIPKGQLPRLRTNNARVDISPVVSDVFVDYEDGDDDGVLSPSERSTGRYRWRTMLVSGSGRLGGELFALDVTDPLKPIVLWDVTARSDNTDAPLPADNTAFTWLEREGDPAPDYDDLAGAARTGPYNFTDFGDSLEMNLVAVRRGNRPSFQLIIATNGAASGAQQLQVFGLDAGTGRKLWQWTRAYGSSTSNSVPGGSSTLDVDGDGGMDRLYAGDMEGRLWELSIHTGVNLNYFRGEDDMRRSYPLFSTRSQYHPISTAPAIMRLPYALGDGLFSTFGVGGAAAGKLALVFGTGGPDWVLAQNPLLRGRAYVVAVSPEELRIREQLTYDRVNRVSSTLSTAMAERGTAKPGAGVSYELEQKERAVGSPRVVGSELVLTTAYGTTESNLLDGDMEGRTHRLDLSRSTGAQVLAEGWKSAAGALVLPDGSVVTQAISGIQRVSSGLSPPAVGLAGKRTPARVGAWLDLGRALSE